MGRDCLARNELVTALTISTHKPSRLLTGFSLWAAPKYSVHLTIFAPVLSSFPMTGMDLKSNDPQSLFAHTQAIHIPPLGWWLLATSCCRPVISAFIVVAFSLGCKCISNFSKFLLLVKHNVQFAKKRNFDVRTRFPLCVLHPAAVHTFGKYTRRAVACRAPVQVRQWLHSSRPLCCALHPVRPCHQPQVGTASSIDLLLLW